MKKTTCVVPGCDSIDTQNDSIKFYQIPKEADARKKWLKAINRTEAEINKKSRVCSKHFKTHDYAITKFNYMGGKSTASGSKNTCEFKALKTEAVPNQLLPQKSTFKIKISKKDNTKQIKVEEVKVKEEKVEKPEKVKMPKRPAPPDSPPPRSRTQSRRAASKEALKQMQLLLDDENDAVEIPDDDVVPIDPSPHVPPPPKKKYKLSHRKSSEGTHKAEAVDRDALALKTITNRDAENTLELDCWVEQLEQVQKDRIKKLQDEEKEIQAKLDSLISQCSGKVIHKGDLNTVIEVSEQVQSAIQGAQAPPTSLILNNNLGGQQSYQLVMDPRMGLIVGAVSQAPPTPPQKVYQGKVQVAQNLQQTPTTSSNPTTPRVATRTRGRGSTNKITPPPPVVTPTRSKAAAQSLPPIPPTVHTRGQATPPTRQAQATPPTRQAQATPPTRQTQAAPPTRQAQATVPQTRTAQAAAAQTRAAQATAAQTRAAQANAAQTRAAQAAAAAQTRAAQAAAAAQTRAQSQPTPPQTRGKASAAVLPAKKQVTVVAAANTPNTRGRGPAQNTFVTSVKPSETSVEGGLTTGSGGPGNKKVVVDLTSDDNNKSAPDSREISFNKLQGKTYPSLVVVARPHLRVQDLSLERPKLDAKVKSVLMHAPTKFTEWLIQQGLIRSEQKCSVHSSTQLKLGMYSDVSKFPYSGGYVWISECCPQRFVSVFSGSLFEGSPHPPMVILKLLYHWACQTNIQNVTQWVKVDNLYVKGMFTWLRSICTVALQTHIHQIGGPGVKVEVGVISLGTTSQDGNQRQVKVEVLGVLESNSKLIRLRAVEPQAEGDRNYKKRFSKILEPLIQWVHPQSILVADLTVDKQTLISMGFSNVVHYSSTQYGNNDQIMDYLRRIVPRMFQNTLSLLSRQIIQQFLDELVWREWFGTSSLQAFDNLIHHLAEQTRFESGMSLIVRLNKVAQNPFKSWNMNVGNSTKAVENTNTNTNNSNSNSKKARNARKPDPPKPAPPVSQEVNRPPKSTSPDVPEQMVPLENYYYGTIDTYSKTPKITLNMKCPFCKSVFDNNIMLMSHLFKHAHNVSMDAQLCRYCLTSVATANDLLKHIATSHPAETKFDNGFCCLICETQYMNPFVLGKHMSKEHCPSELPYQCGTCSYRCSNHKQAIDHFYRTHDNGPTIQCPFCLKSTTVFTASRNIVQNMNYFIQHLQKHQRKQFARRCGKCNLWFVQKDVLKDHQNRMHVSQRGKTGLVPWNAPRNGVMVPKSKMDKYPGDAEVINFATLKLDLSKGLMCKECITPMDTPKHFPSFESCQNPNCQYSTCCTNAMQEHNAKCSKTNNPIAEEVLPFEMFCICGFSHTDGNQMARHLAICERKSAYPSRSDAKSAIVTHSMLDVLGLVRKPEENPKPETNNKSEASKPKPKQEKRKKLKKEDSTEKTEDSTEKAEDSTKKTEDSTEKTEDSVKDEDRMTNENENNQSKQNDVGNDDGKEVKSKKDEESIAKDDTKTNDDETVVKENSKTEEQKTESSVEGSEKSAEDTENIEEKMADKTEEKQIENAGEESEDKQVENTEMESEEAEDAEKISKEAEDTEKKSKEDSDIGKLSDGTKDAEQVASEVGDSEKVSEEMEQECAQNVEDINRDTEIQDEEMPLAENKNNENMPLTENNEDEEMPLVENKETEEKHSDTEEAAAETAKDKDLEKPGESIEDKEVGQPDELNENKDQNIPDTTDREDTSDSYQDKENTTEDKDGVQDHDREDTNDKESFHEPIDDKEESRDDFSEDKNFNEESGDAQEETQDDTRDNQLENLDNQDESQDKEDKSRGSQDESCDQDESQDKLEESENHKEESGGIQEDSQDSQGDSQDIQEESEQRKEDENREDETKDPEEGDDEKVDKEPTEETEYDPEKEVADEPEDYTDQQQPSKDYEAPEKQSLDDDVEKQPEYSEDTEDHTLNNVESSDKEPTITSDDIQNLLSDVVGESDLTSAMDSVSDPKQSENVSTPPPAEMMDIPDGDGEVSTPMETD